MNAYQLGRYAALKKEAGVNPTELTREEAGSVAAKLPKGDVREILKALQDELKYVDKETLSRAPKLGIGGHAWRAGVGAAGGAGAGFGFGRLVQNIKNINNPERVSGYGRKASIPAAIIGAVLGLVQARRKQKALRDPIRAELTSRMPGRLGMRMMRTTELPTQMSIASEMETLGGREKDRIARAIKELALKGKGG